MNRVSEVNEPDLTAVPRREDEWLELSEADLPVDEVYRWTGRPDCGAVVLFSGTARDHAPGRPDVTLLSYEAYTEHVVPAMSSIAESIRQKWPEVRRIAMVHRVGDVPIGSEAVVVAVSSPHRDEAFQAARFAIDTLKATVPIWKRERWNGGDDWGLDAQHLDPAAPPGGRPGSS